VRAWTKREWEASRSIRDRSKRSWLTSTYSKIPLKISLSLMTLLSWLTKHKEFLLSACSLARLSWLGCIEQAQTVFQQLNFMLYAMIRVLLLAWLGLLLVIYSVDSQLSVGIQVMVTKMILTHFCFLSTSKLNSLLLRIMRMQFNAFHHMVLDLAMVLISVYMTTQIKTTAVMLMLMVLTICQ
jgi:hypothetical protein